MDHKKDFLAWHLAKQGIDQAARHVVFHEREIWWCSLGLNVGFEQNGKGFAFERPVIIIKKFSRDTCLVVPLTTRKKPGLYYLPLGVIQGKEASASLSQLRIIDQKRLINRIGRIGDAVFAQLVRKLITINFNVSL